MVIYLRVLLLSVLLVWATNPARSIAALSCPELLALLDEGAATHVQAARWLHGQRSQLHISESVEEVIESLAQLKGIRLQKPADKIARWVEYMRLAMETPGLSDRVRKVYLEDYVLRPEEVPESHYELQRRIAKELGHGDVALTPELRQELARTVVENQRESLGAWWDYLSSKDARQYPAWARVFVLGEVARMGRFDAETGKFTKRDKNQVASFPELNREALAKVISEMERRARHRETLTKVISEFEVRVRQGDREALAKVISELELLAGRSDHEGLKKGILELKKLARQGDYEGAKMISELKKLAQDDHRTFSFSESYGRKLTEAIKERGDPAQTDGQWVKYPKGSAPEKLSQALDGWNTGWCTTDSGTAGHQLKAGDFYVYYSLDSNGLPRVPRLAIRMEGERIVEVRGTAKEQNVDSHIAATAVLDHKLAEFGGQGELYHKRSRHMRQLTAIEAKVENKEELPPADLWFLYEMDGPIQGFGYNKDPRVAKILGDRKIKTREDLATLLAFFTGTRGKKLSGAAADTYTHEHTAAVAKGLGAKKGWLSASDAIDPTAAFNQFKESLSTQNLSTAASVSRLVSDSAVSGEFRRALAGAYVANADPSRLANEVIRHWNHEDERTRRFAKEVLAVGNHATADVPVMHAFSEIEKISNDTKVSYPKATEKWLSDPSRGVELKAEYLRAHVTSADYERLESKLPKGQREAVHREISKKTMAPTFRELAKKQGLGADYFAKLRPESFDVASFEFPKEGKEVTLGSSEGEEGRFDNEKQRAFKFTKPFSMQATDVTNGQYRIYLEVTGSNPKMLADLKKKDPNEPVVEVSWHDSVEYAKWYASIDPTADYRLAWEAEYEFAARGGTSTRYWSGDSEEDLDKVGWTASNAGGKIHPVAEKRPNPFGIYDAHGNVWRWMQDSYTEDLTWDFAKGSGVELDSGSYRVRRGGSWCDDAQRARSAVRFVYSPVDRHDAIGFRLVRTPK